MGAQRRFLGGPSESFTATFAPTSRRHLASGAWEITQGVEMGRPSLLRATALRTADGIRASVGGACVEVLRGEAMV